MAHTTRSKVSFPFIYFCLCVLVYVLTLPFLFIALSRSKYKDSIPSRFFMRNFGLSFSPQYWFHACSFGEIRSLEPLIAKLQQTPCKILITTITHTGFAEAKRLFESSTAESQIVVKYLPFECFLPLYWRHLNELKTLVVTEAEMWKMLFYVVKASGAQTMLINARISKRSLSRYKRFTWFYKDIFSLIDCVLSQSRIDKERLESLGARSVEVFGNLKIFNIPKVNKVYPKPFKLVFIGASTHKGEEKLILESFLPSKEHHPDSILFLVPRHPERFEQVYELILKYGQDKKNTPFVQSNTPHLKVSRFSSAPFEQIVESDIVLVDVLGELINLYAIGDVVILGGSFVKLGGHNPLEPAFFGTKILSGEHIFNQYALFELVKNAVLIQPHLLKRTLLQLDSIKPSFIEFNQEHSLETLIQKITQ